MWKSVLFLVPVKVQKYPKNRITIYIYIWNSGCDLPQYLSRAFQRCGGYNSASLFPQVDVIILGFFGDPSAARRWNLRHPQVFGICEFSQHHDHGRYFWTRVRCGGASFWIRPLIQQLFGCPSLNYSKLVKGRKKNLGERERDKPYLKDSKKNRNKKTQNSSKFQTFHDVSFLGLLSIHHPTPSTTPKPSNPGLRHLGALGRIQAWLGRLQLLRIALWKTWAIGAGGTWHPHGMITSFCETWTNVITYPKIEVIPSSKKRCGGKTSPEPIYLT